MLFINYFKGLLIIYNSVANQIFIIIKNCIDERFILSRL